MATPYTIACTVHCSRAGRGGPSALQAGPKTTGTPWSGRVPRLARLMALALRFDKLLHDGVVKNSLSGRKAICSTASSNCPETLTCFPQSQNWLAC